MFKQFTVAQLEAFWDCSRDEWGYGGPALQDDDVLFAAWVGPDLQIRRRFEGGDVQAIMENRYTPADFLPEWIPPRL